MSGNGSGNGSGYGSGYGYGYGYGSGDGSGYGCGNGDGSGYGCGNEPISTFDVWLNGNLFHVVIWSLTFEVVSIGCQTYELCVWERDWRKIAEDSEVYVSEACALELLAKIKQFFGKEMK